MADAFKIAAAMIAPVLLDRNETTKTLVDAVDCAANGGARLVMFGETHLPACPL